VTRKRASRGGERKRWLAGRSETNREDYDFFGGTRPTYLLRRDLHQSGERPDTSLRGRIKRRRHARSSPPSLSPPPPRRALIEASVYQKAERKNIGEIASSRAN